MRIITHSLDDGRSDYSDQELIDHLTFYLDSRLFHKSLANLAQAGTILRDLHERQAEEYARLVRQIETILRNRKKSHNNFITGGVAGEVVIVWLN